MTAEVVHLRGRLRRMTKSLQDWKHLALEQAQIAEIQRHLLQQQASGAWIADDGSLEEWAQFLAVDADGECWQFSGFPGWVEDDGPVPVLESGIWALAPRQYALPYQPGQVWRVHRY